MKRSLFRPLLVALFVMAPPVVVAKTAPPVFMTGESCPPGSARQNPWILFEDRDGNGAYDFVTAGDCNGDVRGRPWNPSVGGDPFLPGNNDIAIGRLPAGAMNISPDLSFNEEPSGLYSWTIIERAATGAEVCRIRRDATMELDTTCDGNYLE